VKEDNPRTGKMVGDSDRNFQRCRKKISGLAKHE
jgi:hypothetical protein